MPATRTTDVETTVRGFYEPLMTGDVHALDEVLAPSWAAIPELRTGAGAEGWKASITHLRRVFSDLVSTIEDVVVFGDRAAVRSVNRGIHSGELLGVPATGRRIEFRACDIHRLSEGRIVQTWHLEDYFGIAAQLGLKFSL